MPQGAVQPFPINEEYVKNPEITPEDIEKFRQWVKTQPHLPNEHITDLDLLLTYHCCERSTEVAKQVLDLNLTLRTLFPIISKRDVDKRTEQACRVVVMKPLESRTPEGYAVFLTHLIDGDPKNFVFGDIIRAVLMTIDLWQVEEGTWPGLVIAMDMTNVQVSHLARLDLQTIQHFLYYLQEAFLVKLKSLHFLNAPSFMDRLLMMIKPFMKKQLIDTMHVHQIGSDTFDKFLAKSALPKELGGQYKDLKTLRDEVWQKLKANREYFLEENKRRVTESKRPGKPKTITDIFGGVEGSFKKLDID